MKPLLALLLVAAGSSSLVRPFRSVTSGAASYTMFWADTSKLGIPNGPFDLPPEDLCSLGYTATTLALVPAKILDDLQRVRDCQGRVFPKLRRAKTKDAAGYLSVDAARAEIDSWPWPELCGRVKDSTIIAFYVGDDVGKEEWGPAKLPTRLAQWDSIAGLVQAKCPGAPVTIRARATQLEARGKWQWLTTAWAQYTGARTELGSPEKYFAAEVASAKRQHLGLVGGVNLINGGCGPADRGKCLPDVPGTNLQGTKSDSYQLSAAEFTYYKTVAMTNPYVCASVDWVWGPKANSDFHDRPDIQSAAKALNVLAAKRPSVSCVVR